MTHSCCSARVNSQYDVGFEGEGAIDLLTLHEWNGVNVERRLVSLRAKNWTFLQDKSTDVLASSYVCFERDAML